MKPGRPKWIAPQADIGVALMFEFPGVTGSGDRRALTILKEKG
jgi:hypothetical protein